MTIPYESNTYAVGTLSAPIYLPSQSSQGRATGDARDARWTAATRNGRGLGGSLTIYYGRAGGCQRALAPCSGVASAKHE